MDDNKAFAIMTCNGCGRTEEFSPSITAEDLINNPADTLMDAKTYFTDAGWFTSLGFDLCPECKEAKEKT